MLTLTAHQQFCSLIIKGNLLTRQSNNTGQLLALEKLQAGTATSGNVAQLILNLVLGGNGGSVTATNDDNLAILLAAIDDSVKGCLGALGEVRKLEDTSRAVPENSLGLVDSLLVELDGLVAAVEAHPALGNAVGIGGVANLGVLGELVGSDIVDGQDDLDVVLLRLGHEVRDGLGAGLIEQGVADGHVLEDLLEGECHATADDERVDLVEQVVDELDLVRDLGATEDGEERTLRRLESLGEVVELLLHEETGRFLGKLDTDHGGVSTVSSAESVVCTPQAH